MMTAPQPLIDIASGSARFLTALPQMETGHNFSNDVGNVDAADDWAALLAFLNEYRHSAKTFRSYAAELERLCLWMVHIRKIPLSGLKRADLADYYEFLQAPPASWCAPSAKKFRRDGGANPHWRPFKVNADDQAGLAVASVQRVQKILQSMFTYLVDEGYLLGNPATAKRTKGQRSSKMNRSVERFLQPHEAAFVAQVLRDSLTQAVEIDDKDLHFKALRRCYVYDLFLHTGLRISEPVHYTMGDIQIRGSGEKKTLCLQVCGKGNIEGESRNVALGHSFVEILKVYRLALNGAMKHKNWTPLDPLPAFEEATPLIPDMSGLRPIGERQVSNIFAEIRDQCVDTVDRLLAEHNEPERVNDLMRMRSTLASFTCHWMRHTHATYFLALSGDLRATQDRLGHADLSTTQIYVHLLDQSRADAANKFDPQKMAELL